MKVRGFCTRQDFHRPIGGSNSTPSDDGEENFVLCLQKLFGQISLLVPTYMTALATAVYEDLGSTPEPESVKAFRDHMSLLPGDVIACGTSIGVGTMKNPTNTVEVSIEGVGTLSNIFAQ